MAKLCLFSQIRQERKEGFRGQIPLGVGEVVMRRNFQETKVGTFFHTFNGLLADEIEKGIRVKTLVVGTVQLRHLDFEPGTLIPDHHHPEEVLTMILEGTMEMRVGDETRAVRAGDVFRVPPKTSHSGRVFSERVVAVSWSPIQ